MRNRVLLTLGVVAVLAVALWVTRPREQVAAESDPAFPRLEYADSLESLNDRCMVQSRKLSAHVRPVYANGAPLGFC